jgi:ribosomal protein S27E
MKCPVCQHRISLFGHFGDHLTCPNCHAYLRERNGVAFVVGTIVAAVSTPQLIDHWPLLIGLGAALLIGVAAAWLVSPLVRLELADKPADKEENAV